MRIRTSVVLATLLLFISTLTVASDLFPNADLEKPYEDWTYAEYYEMDELHMLDGFNCGVLFAMGDDCAYPDAYYRNAERKSGAIQWKMWQTAVNMEFDTSYSMKAMLFAVIEVINEEVAKNNQQYVWPGEEFVPDEEKIQGYSVIEWTGWNWNQLTPAEKIGFAHGVLFMRTDESKIAPSHITAVEYAQKLDEFFEYGGNGNFLIFAMLALSSSWGLLN